MFQIIVEQLQVQSEATVLVKRQQNFKDIKKSNSYIKDDSYYSFCTENH